MKKCIAILLVFTALLSLCQIAFADSSDEPFELRSGIHFGDTMDDVLQKETTLTRESDTSNWFKGKIAGISNAECGFMFDDDGLLTEMCYSFTKYNSSDSVKSDYETLYSSLVRKYGTPLNNIGGSTHLITGIAIEKWAINVSLATLLGGSGDYSDYDEWIVDTVDGHVKIDIIRGYTRDSSYEYSYFMYLSYHFYTDADYLEAVDEKMAERAIVDDDL